MSTPSHLEAAVTFWEPYVLHPRYQLHTPPPLMLWGASLSSPLLWIILHQTHTHCLPTPAGEGGAGRNWSEHLP